jgi:hypothetical protein
MRSYGCLSQHPSTNNETREVFEKRHGSVDLMYNNTRTVLQMLHCRSLLVIRQLISCFHIYIYDVFRSHGVIFMYI